MTQRQLIAPKTTPDYRGSLRYPAAKRWQLLLVAVSMVACVRSDKNVVDDRALSDVTRGEDWLAFGRTLNEQRFSPLRQIDTSTVGGLKVDWFIDLPDKSGLVSTPLVSNGVLYFIGSMNLSLIHISEPTRLLS